MNRDSGYINHATGVIKDSIIILLIFVSFSFINIEVAAFISVICTAVLLTRRIILDYNPGFIKGFHIYSKGKELSVPEGVDVVDLGNDPSINHLCDYVEVIRGMLVPPKILIIRFCGIIQMKESELEIFRNTLCRLAASKIIVILSDVEENVGHQFGQNEVEAEMGPDNVFYGISDALLRANKILKQPKNK